MNTAPHALASLSDLATLSDQDLVRAYLADLNASSFGVNYGLAQEMQRRKFRSAKTAKLTRAGQALARSLNEIAQMAS